MSKESCIEHPRNMPFTVIKGAYVSLFNGDTSFAAVLYTLEYLTNGEMERIGAAGDNRPAWLQLSIQHFSDRMLGHFSRDVISDRLSILSKLGIVETDVLVRGKCKKYLLNCDLVNNLISSKAVIRLMEPDDLSKNRQVEEIVDLSENRQVTYRKIDRYLSKNRQVGEAASLLVFKEYKKKKEYPLPPAEINTPVGVSCPIQDTDVSVSNRELRLGPDLECIEESEDLTLQEKTEKDYGAASRLRTQSGGWTLADRELFRARFKALRKAKAPRSDIEWNYGWMERNSISPEDAILAIDGFRSSEEHTLRAFRAAFSECLDRGRALQDELPPAETMPTSYTPPIDAPQRAETAKNPVPEILERWNLLAPSSPVTGWNPKRDDETRLRSLLRDAEFLAAFDGVASKCEAIHQAGSEWSPTFKWILKKSGKVDNWWRVHTGEFDWAAKPRKKTGRSKVESDMDIALQQMLSQIGDK